MDGPFDVPEEELDEFLKGILETMTDDALAIIDGAMERQNLPNRIEAMKFCMRHFKDTNDAMGLDSNKVASNPSQELLKRLIKVQ